MFIFCNLLDVWICVSAEDAESFKVAQKKFYRLFNMPDQEKLASCKSYVEFSPVVLYIFHYIHIDILA